MGSVQNARTAVEVLTQTGTVRSARTAVEVLTQQRGNARLARTAIEALTQRPKAALARNAVEVLIPNVVPMQFEWGILWVVVPPMPAGLVVDLQAGVGSTLQTSGGSAASADNDPVGAWKNSITSSQEAVGSGGARPLLKKSIYNGQDTLRFDGSDDQLIFPGNADHQVANPTIFVVAKSTSDGGRCMIFKGYYTSGWSNPYALWGTYHLSGQYRTRWNGPEYVGGGWTTGDLEVIEMTDADLYKNGVKAVDGTSGNLSYPNGITPILISGNGVGSERFAGDISRIMIFNRKLDDIERSQVRVMLGTQYGVTVTP